MHRRRAAAFDAAQAPRKASRRQIRACVSVRTAKPPPDTVGRSTQISENQRVAGERPPYDSLSQLI
jgi:hypothetical protein